jgi:penicillin-binding protein 2
MSLTSLRNRMLEAFRKRVLIFSACVAFAFFILVLQLFNLQIIQGEEYARKAKSNMENYIPIAAPRGEIFDRTFEKGVSGVALVSNRPSFNIVLIPENFKSDKELQGVLENLSEITPLNAAATLKELRQGNPWERFIVKDDVPFDVIVKMASHRHLFNGIFYEDAPVRVYNYSEIFSHSVGYIGSISREEHERLKTQGYKYYQTIGKAGIEREYDKILRGEDGFIRRIVDVMNRTEGEEVGLEPSAGNNIVLTLDYDVQKAAFDALGNSHGTVIAVKPATGEIITLVSKPGYDPNRIISRDNSVIIRDLLTDKSKPFLNRAIQAKYPPASTFKLVTTVAALETEKTYPDKRYTCTGKYTLKGYRDTDFYCFRAHGSLDLYQAIGKSCSAYFYNLGQRVGPTEIMKYADYLGLGEKTGIDIPGEISGFVPSQQWKMKTFGQPWFDGDTINLSIGQGFLSVTPMALADMLCGIVNNGNIYRPHIIKEVYTPDNSRIIKSFRREKIREIPLAPLTLDTIKKGMRYSVTSGTSARLRYLGAPIAGKTGTAQTRSIRKQDATQHAWFLGYAPFDGDVEETVVVAVLIEYGQWGAVAAVPVAEKVFAKMIEKNYFTRQK